MGLRPTEWNENPPPLSPPRKRGSMDSRFRGNDRRLDFRESAAKDRQASPRGKKLQILRYALDDKSLKTRTTGACYPSNQASARLRNLLATGWSLW